MPNAHHPALAHHFDTLDQQQEAASFGMWVFLLTEILFFGALFMVYTIYRMWYPGAFAAASQHLVSYLCEYYGSQPGAPFFTSNNMAVHTGLFRALGGFDTGFPRAAGEDREFCDRWHAQGHTARYAPEAVVSHTHQLTRGSFWLQHFNYGRAALRFHQLRARRDHRWITPESPAFYLRMLRYPFVQKTGHQPWVHALLLAVSQLANAAGAVGEGLAQGGRLAREIGPRR